MLLEEKINLILKAEEVGAFLISLFAKTVGEVDMDV